MYLISQKNKSCSGGKWKYYKILICKIIAHTQNVTIHFWAGIENINMPKDDERSTNRKKTPAK